MAKVTRAIGQVAGVLAIISIPFNPGAAMILQTIATPGHKRAGTLKRKPTA